MKLRLPKSWIGKASKVVTNRKRLKAVLQEAVQLLGREDHLKGVKDEAMILVNLVQDTVKRRYKGLNKKNLIFVVGAILYLISPLDLIPDFLVGIGFGDDLAILTYVFRHLKQEIDAYKEWKGR